MPGQSPPAVRTFLTIINGGSPRPPGRAGRAIRSGRSRRTRTATRYDSKDTRAVLQLTLVPCCSLLAAMNRVQRLIPRAPN